jgi:hypothetical protein
VNAQNSGRVSVSTKFTHALGDGRTDPVQTELEWDPKDPYAITVRFPEYCVAWLISRELISDALTRERAGEGDVRFTQSRCGCCVFMELDGHGGYAKFLVPRTCLVEILEQTAFQLYVDQAAEVEQWLAEVIL